MVDFCTFLHSLFRLFSSSVIREGSHQPMSEAGRKLGACGVLRVAACVRWPRRGPAVGVQCKSGQAALAINIATTSLQCINESTKRAEPPALAAVATKVWEYHSCFVFVDKKNKIVFIHNPWRENTARTKRVVRLADLRPHLLHLFAQKFLTYDIYYKAGAQVGSSDCRVQVLRFARIFGLTNLIALRTNPSAFGWKLLAH